MARVLIVCDVFWWAQHRHALGVQKYAPDWCEVEVTDLSGYNACTPDRLAGFDVVHVLYLASAARRPGIRRLTSMLASHAWMHAELKQNDWRTRGVTQGRCLAVAKEVLAGLDAVVARNGELKQFGRKFRPNTRFIPVGVDLELFKPAEPERAEKLRVGWCGQIGGKTSFKGHAEVLTPLVKRLGDKYDFITNTSGAKHARDVAAMAEWYRGLDVFVSTSCAEGTPNPPFEAAACGVPVISTSVGLVRHWSRLSTLGLQVPDYYNQAGADRVVGAIASLLQCLDTQPQYRLYCGKELASSVKAHFNYRTLAPKLLEYLCHG